MDMQSIRREIASYEDSLEPQDRARLSLFEALWSIMSRTSAQAAATVEPVPVDELVQDLAEGQPFMANHPIAVDAESYADVVELLTSCVIDIGVYSSDANQALKMLNMRQFIAVSDLDLASVDPAR